MGNVRGHNKRSARAGTDCSPYRPSGSAGVLPKVERGFEL